MATVRRILVVDDEETLCEAVRFNLEAEGYLVDTVYSAEEALALDMSRYDLLLLDIMMGEISGTQLARILRSRPSTSSLPIIFCTARDGEDDMVKGLDLGADDYITKPYSMRNLMARIRTILRRADPTGRDTAAGSDVVSYGTLSIFPDRKVVTIDGVDVRFPRKEYEILLRLLSNPGRIFSREELLEQIWPDEVVVVDRVVDVNITRIRQKLGRYGRNIVTRSGYGYGFVGE